MTLLTYIKDNSVTRINWAWEDECGRYYLLYSPVDWELARANTSPSTESKYLCQVRARLWLSPSPPDVWWIVTILHSAPVPSAGREAIKCSCWEWGSFVCVIRDNLESWGSSLSCQAGRGHGHILYRNWIIVFLNNIFVIRLPSVLLWLGYLRKF